MSVIQTTLGEIDLTQMGRVNAHEHIVIDGETIEQLYPHFIHNDVEKLAEELMQWKEAGGGVIIDCSPINAGRDIEKLSIISRKANLPIIVSTGFHKENYYRKDHWVYSKTCDEISEILFAECFNGIQDRHPNGEMAAQSQIKAGVIKLAIDKTGITPHLEKLLSSILILNREFNVPLLLHTEPDIPFKELLHWLESNQTIPEKIVFCHMDKVTDLNIQQLMTSKGYFLEFDSLTRENPGLEKFSAMLKRFIDLGMSEQILFGGDLARRSYWRCYGGNPGLSYLVNQATEGMVAYGIQRTDLEKIWKSNPQKWLG